jgi:serine/threonine protein kinase/formylglycine-generating enzyme required for sulfatase activity
MKECSKCRHCYDDAYTICPLDDRPLMTTITSNVVISGRYMLEERLGNGGMGIVFRARHKFLKSQHAVKIILPSLVEQDGNLLARFKQEAVLAASIDHPNVIRVTDFGVEDDKMPFLVMEFVDGLPISDSLQPGVPLSVKDSFDLFEPIAAGVAEAHRKGIVHRDLKPQNIMVQKGLPMKKAVKVLDFGLAKIKASESLGSFIQTQTRNILGSPPYMSPEQWENEGVDHRADIYALGVILFQMLTGHLPFDGESIPAVMFKHLTAEIPTFVSVGSLLAPEIETVVRRALQKDREARPTSVEEMLGEFEHAIKRAENLSLPSTIETEFMSKPTLSDKAVPPTANNALPPTADNVELPPTVLDSITSHLTKSQREKLFSYFDSSQKDTLLPDNQLAQEFLEAKDRAEEAKVKANEHDKLVREFAEAQKYAEEAERKALEAKQKMEQDVRRRLEAEMQDKLMAQQQARQLAEAERLAKEVEARKNAEERANYLAQAALEAQKQAELERKKSEQAAHQRELEESVRRQAEIQALQLTRQVEEAKRKFEEAKKQAEYEASLRAAAEAKQKNIESELLSVAEQEARRRKLIEAEAEKHLKEKVSRFEKEAQTAQRRVEEARQLAELEAAKREEAEAARLHAEQEAKRLAQEIIEAQKHIEELKLHTSVDAQHQSSPRVPMSGNWDASSNPTIIRPAQNLTGDQTVQIINLGDTGETGFQSQSYQPQQPTTQMSGQAPSNLRFSDDLHTRLSAPPRRFSPVLIAGSVLAVLLMMALGGVLIYFFVLPKPQTDPNGGKTTGDGTNAAKSDTIANKAPLDISKNLVKIEGGSFQMGRSDVPKLDGIFGNQFPAHNVTVDSFMISKTETSNEEYAEFVQDAKYQSPQDWKNGKPPEGEEKLPVTFVSMNDAKAYADWASKKLNKQCRLPSEEEWEYAARNGSQATSFPWSNTWQASLTNINTGKKSPVGTSSDETMVGGLKDMLGNVQEWTSSKFALYPGHTANKPPEEMRGDIVIRGSAYVASSNLLQNPQWLITFRFPSPADQKTSPFVGFRIVCQP